MWYIRLYYASLLAGDLFEALPQYFNMVEADIGADRQHRSQHIGRVEATAKANFDDGDINFLVAEVFEGESGDYFKKREFFFTITLR